MKDKELKALGYEKVQYGEGRWFDSDAGRVWNQDLTVFAMAERCEYCGKIVGTGVGYLRGESVDRAADRFVARSMDEHIRKVHPQDVEPAYEIIIYADEGAGLDKDGLPLIDEDAIYQ